MVALASGNAAAIPSATLRAGVVYLQDAAGNFHPYNLNPGAVTVSGVSNSVNQGNVTFAPANCAGNPGPMAGA